MLAMGIWWLLGLVLGRLAAATTWRFNWCPARGELLRASGPCGSLLRHAARHEIDGVEASLRQGADPATCRDESNGSSALVVAAHYHGGLDTLRLLLEKRADLGDQLNVLERTPLLASVMCARDFRMVKFLVDARADVNRPDSWHASPLMKATLPETGCSDLVQKRAILRYLIDHGADVDSRDRAGGTALIRAMGCGADLSMVNYLLDHRANVNAVKTGGWSSLMEGAAQCDRPKVQSLVEHGANVNQQDASGQTALTEAARSKCRSTSGILRFLVENGAYIDHRSHAGESSLALASLRNELRSADTLMKLGASLVVRDHLGRTPLMLAAKSGHVPLVQRLVNCSRPDLGFWNTRGSSCAMYARDATGMTAKDWARLAEQEEVEPLLDDPLPWVTWWRLVHRPTFWCIMVVCLSTAAVIVWIKDASEEDHSVSFSRALLLVVAQSSWPVYRQILAQVFRFLDIAVVGVGGIWLSLWVRPVFWLPIWFASCLLPAWVQFRGELLRKPALLLASAGGSLRCMGLWKGREIVGFVLATLRIGLLVGLASLIRSSHKLVDRRAKALNRRAWTPAYLDELGSTDHGKLVGLLGGLFNLEGQAARQLQTHIAGKKFCVPVVGLCWESQVSVETVAKFSWPVMCLICTLYALATFGLLLRQCIRCCCTCGTEDHQEVEDLLDEALRVDKAALRSDPTKALLSRHVSRQEPTCIRLRAGLLMLEVAFLLADVALDLNTANTLLMSESAFLAGIILCVSLVSAVEEIRSGFLCRLPRELREMIRTGLPTDAFLVARDRERGFEAPVSLLVSAYALPFAIRTPFQAVTGGLTLASSCWGLAGYLCEQIDAALPELEESMASSEPEDSSGSSSDPETS